MSAPPGLDTGLLVDAEYVIARPQRCTFPPALVEIDDAAGFAGKLRITREYPAAMAPRTQCVLAKPAPERRATDFCHKTARHCLLSQLGDRPSCQGQTATRRQLTSKRLDRNHNTGGKSALVARRVAARRGPAAARNRSADATY